MQVNSRLKAPVSFQKYSAIPTFGDSKPAEPSSEGNASAAEKPADRTSLQKKLGRLRLFFLTGGLAGALLTLSGGAGLYRTLHGAEPPGFSEIIKEMDKNSSKLERVGDDIAEQAILLGEIEMAFQKHLYAKLPPELKALAGQAAFQAFWDHRYIPYKVERLKELAWKVREIRTLAGAKTLRAELFSELQANTILAPNSMTDPMAIQALWNASEDYFSAVSPLDTFLANSLVGQGLSFLLLALGIAAIQSTVEVEQRLKGLKKRKVI